MGALRCANLSLARLPSFLSFIRNQAAAAGRGVPRDGRGAAAVVVPVGLLVFSYTPSAASSSSSSSTVVLGVAASKLIYGCDVIGVDGLGNEGENFHLQNSAPVCLCLKMSRPQDVVPNVNLGFRRQADTEAPSVLLFFRESISPKLTARGKNQPRTDCYLRCDGRQSGLLTHLNWSLLEMKYEMDG